MNRRIRKLLLPAVLARSFSERGRRTRDVEQVVGHLKGQAHAFTVDRDAVKVGVRGARVNRARARGGANERAGLSRMNIFERRGVGSAAARFEVHDLAANHAPRADGRRKLVEDAQPTRLTGYGGRREDSERQRQQGIASKDRRRLAECHVAGGFPPAQVVVVERGQVVMNQRIGVDEFDGAAEF